jgi:hypothetical protein
MPMLVQHLRNRVVHPTFHWGPSGGNSHEAFPVLSGLCPGSHFSSRMQPAGPDLRDLTSDVPGLDVAGFDVGGFDVAVPTVGLWETLLHRWSEPNT